MYKEGAKINMYSEKTADAELQNLISETIEVWLTSKEKESSQWNEKTYDSFQAIKNSPFLREIFQTGLLRGLIYAIEIASKKAG